MDYSILKDHMKSLSTESLKSYLGEDLVESLLEWHTGDGPFATKARLVDMILSIHGLSILRNRDFRKELLKTFPDNLYDFRVSLPKKYETETDKEILVEVISSTSWANNNVTGQFLRLLNYQFDEVFEKKEELDDSVSEISSHDKFYELLDYQYIIRQKALTILNSEYSLRRFLIHMPTGTGKTKTATHIICHHYNYNLKKDGLVLWVAHTKELLQQAYDTFVSVWKNIGNGNIKTYKLWDEYNVDVPEEGFNGFMVCGIQKLQSIKSNNPELFDAIVKDTRLFVFDEAHKALATETKTVVESFMRKFDGMPDRALMGLSATPGRTTELSIDNDLLARMFGNKIISIDTKLMNAVSMSAQEAANAEVEKDVIKYFQKRGVLSTVTKEELVYAEQLSDAELNQIKVVANNNGYDDFSTKALEVIGKNKNRNLRILQKLRELNYQKLPTIVFACSVKHAQLLSAMLSLEDIPNRVVVGDMSSKERREAIASFKDTTNDMNILINYEVLTTGFDATNIKCVFIARPTQSIVLYSQMLGRGLRGPQMGGSKDCLLVDIKDNLKQFDENMAFSHFDNYWNN